MYKDKLKELRESNNLKQNILADILNITIKAYSMYETEYEIIPIKHLINLANYYNVSIDYIFNFSSIKQYKTNNVIDNKLSGNRIKALRKENKMTQTNFADVIKCSYGTIAGYESGRYLIATPFLYTICKKYKISADYLLGKTNEPISIK